MDERAKDILDFWFPPEVIPGPGRPDGVVNPIWFFSTPEFDREIEDQFLRTYLAAEGGELGAWLNDARSAVALVICLDQFPRNMFRGQARCFATDAMGLSYADRAIGLGYDMELASVMRGFFYLPFMHSEDLETQKRSLELYRSHGNMEYAQGHYDIIARFGRFPHRNEILGRQSTPDEIKFINDPGSGY